MINYRCNAVCNDECGNLVLVNVLPDVDSSTYYYILSQWQVIFTGLNSVYTEVADVEQCGSYRPCYRVDRMNYRHNKHYKWCRSDDIHILLVKFFRFINKK